ncbi:uncharacterized protein LOC144211945 [Stigmatopora nigra]
MRVRRHIQGGTLPHRPSSNTRPLPTHGPPRKYPAPLINHTTLPHGNVQKPPALGTVSKLKAFMSSFLSSGRTAARPPAFHMPWNKARTEPVEVEKIESLGKRDRIGNNGRTETQGGEERIQKWPTGVETETGKHEFRRELPGLVRNGGHVINGSCLRGSHGLTYLDRRIRGPARVGGPLWSNGRDRGSGRVRKISDSVGNRSVSALVSGRSSAVERGKTWRGSSFRAKRDLESEFNPSDSDIPSSSNSTERDDTESDTESQSKSGSRNEELDSEREFGSDSEDSYGLKEAPSGGQGRECPDRRQSEEDLRRVDISDSLSPILEDTEEETSA